MEFNNSIKDKPLDFCFLSLNEKTTGNIIVEDTSDELWNYTNSLDLDPKIILEQYKPSNFEKSSLSQIENKKLEEVVGIISSSIAELKLTDKN